MEECPDEVLLKVCDLLDFKSVASLRRVNKHLAEVGAEALVKRVRFHCSQVSLERLAAIAQHDVFNKYVDTIVFEGNILANVGCIHTYSAHYELEHHKNERPQSPGKNATARERRLYERNVAKFNRDIIAKYDRYRDFYERQQGLLKSSAYSDFISPSIPRFPRLNKLVLSTVGRCKHVLSKRFLETFAVDCAMPIETDTRYTKDQLKHLLFPQGCPLTTLHSLEVHVISPKFFTGFMPRDSICEAFKNLKIIDLNFRLEKDDRHDLDVSSAERCYGELGKGSLREALAGARDLQELTINFDDFGFFGACVNMEHILGDHTWPSLKVLDVDCMSTTEDYLLNMLKRQTELERFRLGFMTLDDGRWPTATLRMRRDLHLVEFSSHGLLEDSEQMYPMHYIDGDAYMDDFHEFSLAAALDLYVTDVHDEDDQYHPLEDTQFEDPEELRERYGPFSDDDFSDMDCSD
ncbi:hypothetical protein HRR83_005137 [Exophiala dermatitidis]|uniref:F-box domain-containing protein n=2 Tax=Exophiala dermatitidis TaxID=5970 RepID=H6C2Y9_EXODN|nr:uncharacterized protein HMPREF1120_06022 [Exophiala dermatitidis NIH/UT8656]KAJ4516949.1 hypothetical protein HRR74_004698 [Exophiala dermatitidis]EHY58004.1 hypothetical protein HMPREF1120_06022 [Exophiala dermatitidis NIH/UT8656]KAJ4519872.1 hypothetical protein HRR73_003933 [Exophiala dermatitidis]KAJ4534319.1 hypothetical protein HRR76_006247 [Exophiala dermatitidis]KAJ4541459.1 hypothetical protein HRR77_006251 [Exophiala dermatitidis]